jgi:hypothetical protein
MHLAPHVAVWHAGDANAKNIIHEQRLKERKEKQSQIV